MLKDHPIIEDIEMNGYPFYEEQSLGMDALGNEILVGDVVFEFNDEIFVEETLSAESVEILKVIGAERTIAQ
ncbi:hypothetical protein ACTWP4_18800 [Gracilibacillus sp. D59]|uniref:hypothetical protein n=1 Tax=Gracilibacillus sp. D59 TaxID=3457434 RepID=UPI003FCD7834